MKSLFLTLAMALAFSSQAQQLVIQNTTTSTLAYRMHMSNPATGDCIWLISDQYMIMPGQTVTWASPQVPTITWNLSGAVVAAPPGGNWGMVRVYNSCPNITGMSAGFNTILMYSNLSSLNCPPVYYDKAIMEMTCGNTTVGFLQGNLTVTNPTTGDVQVILYP